MRHFSDAYAALRRKNRGQYALLAGCSFFSVLLITAYVCMMRSPTILSVLPEGGDSRKQGMMVFVLAVIGCAGSWPWGQPAARCKKRWARSWR